MDHGDEQPYSERHLAQLEQQRDAAVVPQLVATIRQQQHDLDTLRLSLGVSQRDREELRGALLAAREEIRALRQQLAAREPSPGAEG